MGLSEEKGIVPIPYGEKKQLLKCSESEIKAIIECRGFEENSKDPRKIIQTALENPIGTKRLCKLACKMKKVLIITSDHTRPVPSKITLPLLLTELRKENPDIEIKILVATGVHRSTTMQEMESKFGLDLLQKETIMIHEAFDNSQMAYKGKLPSGCELSVNKLVDWADMTIAEGFIEPHFFAGFSGGRKSILPGIASAASIMANHCSALVGDERARTGILEGNPINEDMERAAKAANLSFILNVVLDDEKNIIEAFAGEAIEAHHVGCDFLLKYACKPAVYADIVVTSNGGYPLDQNIYQSVKSMTAAEACVNQGGVIICVSRCEKGSGGEQFVRWFSESKDVNEVIKKIEKTSAEETISDQWQAQILARVMAKGQVILVADEMNRDIVESMGMIYETDVNAALSKAKELLGRNYDGVVVIPNGISVIIKE